MSSFHFVNANKGWAVGEYNGYSKIFRTTDGGENWVACNSASFSYYNSVRFVNENIGWAAGGNGLGTIKSIIFKTTDGGNVWYEQKNPSIGGLSNLYFLNENTGWVIGKGILKTTNGGGIVSERGEKGYRIPEQIKLSQNYPNPFNPSTTIKYRLYKSSIISLKIYDVLGRVISTLVDEKQQEGDHEVVWEARNISSGIYFYTLTVGAFSEAKKMILIR
jgi:hypothetical protein